MYIKVISTIQEGPWCSSYGSYPLQLLNRVRCVTDKSYLLEHFLSFVNYQNNGHKNNKSIKSKKLQLKITNYLILFKKKKKIHLEDQKFFDSYVHYSLKVNNNDRKKYLQKFFFYYFYSEKLQTNKIAHFWQNWCKWVKLLLNNQKGSENYIIIINGRNFWPDLLSLTPYDKNWIRIVHLLGNCHSYWYIS